MIASAVTLNYEYSYDAYFETTYDSNTYTYSNNMSKGYGLEDCMYEMYGVGIGSSVEGSVFVEFFSFYKV